MTDQTRAMLERVAAAYGALKHTPREQQTARVYSAFKLQIWRQYQVLDVMSGMAAVPQIRFTDTDPYSHSDAMLNACDHGLVNVYRTATDLPTNHPLAALAPNGETFNTIFRAVHDLLGHWIGRNSFGPDGELAAFRAHARTLSPSAIHAMATETLGQNAWFNFGPYAHLTPSARPYAEQKACLLPWHYIQEFL